VEGSSPPVWVCFGLAQRHSPRPVGLKTDPHPCPSPTGEGTLKPSPVGEGRGWFVPRGEGLFWIGVSALPTWARKQSVTRRTLPPAPLPRERGERLKKTLGNF
jgi:hypothetical protein